MEIGNFAYSGCSSLSSVTIPNSVMSIGKNAFLGCRRLSSISVESGNTIYDSRNSCNAIIKTASNTLIFGCKNTIIPNSVTSIDDCAFYGSGLVSITIPNTVTTIGESAFEGCRALTSITIPYSVTTIGNQTFFQCSGLTSVTIPNSVTSIGFWAFNGCSSLTSVTIPNSVTSIGNGAFSDCWNLTSVIIPNSVTSIGDAFSGCWSLSYVTIKSETPLEIYNNTFTYRANATLYVPKGSKTDYENADYWKDFKEIVEISGINVSYVDLGLPSGLLWATCNLEAWSPEEVGGYYAWGEISPKTYFSRDNYEYKNNTISISNISGTEYDAATYTLGGTWRMPTQAELEELAKNCKRTETTLNPTLPSM